MNIIMTTLLLCIALMSLYHMQYWKNKAKLADVTLSELRQKIKKRNASSVDLELATTPQIFIELSKRGGVILLIPHHDGKFLFVETLVSRLSPSQTISILQVAHNRLSGLEADEEEYDGDE